MANTKRTTTGEKKSTEAKSSDFDKIADLNLAFEDSSHANTTDADTINKIEEGYETLRAAKDCKSLLKQHFSKEVMNTCKKQKTKLGASLWDVIQSGVKNLDSRVGIYAPDAESYTTFALLFEPVLKTMNDISTDTVMIEFKTPEDIGTGKIDQLLDLEFGSRGQVHHVFPVRMQKVAGRIPVQPLSH